MQRIASRLVAATLVGAVCLMSLPAAAQWVWRDANGRITASDRPPPKEVPDKDIVSRPAAESRRVVTTSGTTSGTTSATAAATAASAALAASAPAAVPSDPRLEARKRAAEEEQAARTRAEEASLAARRAENCRRARGHLAALDSGQRIARTNEKGEREILDDKGRADEQRQAREVIASDCK